MLIALLLAVAAVFVLAAAAASSPVRTGHGRAAGRGLAGLPVAAQGAVSRALGRGDPSYRAVAVAGGLMLRNRGQRLVARFGARGVEVRSGRARLGLSLSRYGYGGALGAVGAAWPRAQANRIVYQHGPLSEWYANGPLGLEQGFTLAASPARHASGLLTVALALSGNVRASLSRGASAVTFTGPGGVTLDYRGLVATDATGRTLPSRIELVGGGLLVRVDDAGVQYPLRIDPFIQQAKLTASDGAQNDVLGWSVAVSGDTIAAGAQRHRRCQ